MKDRRAADNKVLAKAGLKCIHRKLRVKLGGKMKICLVKGASEKVC